MKQAILDAISRARAGYSELRVRRVWSSTVLVRGRAVEVAGSARETGGLARCCSPGTGWGSVGFSGADRLDRNLLQAHELSLAAASRQPVTLAPIPIRKLEGVSALSDDPREVTLAEKRQRAESLAAVLFAADRRISAARLCCRDAVIETWLATSEGTWIHEIQASLTLAVLALAQEEGNVERALGSLGVRGGWGSLGAAEALMQDVAGKAVERLHAAPIRPGSYTVVLDPAAAGALVHRAVAHLARPALPGADSDVLPLGTRVGPECLSVGDDPSAEGLWASAVCDDEGTLARRSVIIQNGVVLGHLHNRETAAASGQAPMGHARAGSLRGEPHPRASNTYLAPDRGTLADLLEGVRLGVYVSEVLGCEGADDYIGLRAGQARMIREGSFAEPVKGVAIGGELLELLGRVDAVAADFVWDTRGGRCRDGAAGVVPVSTGAPHLRLVQVPVGAGPR
ncbi:MAG TPA: TldD/PmbA family protein [Gemmatimonadales bacterium]|nr:TldD/PmbA family protein [Gemmatimonadales bacterium]